MYSSQFINVGTNSVSIKMRGLHKTNIEIEMRKILTNMNIDFVEQYPIRCKYKAVGDFRPEYGRFVVDQFKKIN